MRVADGTWDASVEFVKGYRPWDFAPGAFVAQGAEAAVLDIRDGRPIGLSEGQENFSLDGIKAFVLGGPGATKSDESRQKFVVAATTQLAGEILDVYRNTV